MQLDLVSLLEYLLWLLGRLCRLPSISLPPQACCWHLGTLCPHNAEGDTQLSGRCQVKRPEPGSCVCKVDFVFQERRASTNPGPDGKTSETELGRAGGGEAVAATPGGLEKGRQLWLLPHMCWAVTAAMSSLPSATGTSGTTGTDHLAVLPPSPCL